MKMKLRKLTLVMLGLGLVSGVYASVDLKTDNDKLSYTIGNLAGNTFKAQSLTINPVLFRQGVELANGVYSSLDLKTSADKLSYRKGYEVGSYYKKQDVTLNSVVFQEGLSDGLAGATPALPMEKQRIAIKNFEKEREYVTNKQFTDQSTKNAAEGKAFFATNAQATGVNVTQSGLQYTLVEPGKGQRPTAADTVTVAYQCILLDKTMCSGGYQGNKPVSFHVDDLIPGLSEALQLMQAGSTYTFYVPSKLAYGQAGAPGVIGPNQTLIFTIKLLSVKSAQ
jgi:FKBP-type peptidyl-prolyl cis-trans isomerase FklB